MPLNPIEKNNLCIICKQKKLQNIGANTLLP